VGDPAVESVEAVSGGLRIVLRAGVNPEQVSAELNRKLVEAGIAVHRLEPARVSLEHRFLEITSRLGGVE
jgi:hypothetical protein